MEEITKYLFLIVAYAVKFGFTVPFGIYTYNLSFFESVILSMIGGTVGVIFFVYLSKYLIAGWNHFLGVFLAVRFYPYLPKTIMWLLSSVVFWAIVLSAVFQWLK